MTIGDGIRELALLPTAAPIPQDGVLLHIGVHKTGTTAIQAALAAARPDLEDFGVLYPGKLQAQHRAALAVLQRHWGWNARGGAVLDRAHFDKLARKVRASSGRTVISSEFFCEADEETCRQVVRELGGERVRIVVTLRNLGKLLPSSWQQYLKYGLTASYEKWLGSILATPGGSSMSPTFWRRHDHGAVVSRWAAAAGPENVTVLVLEDVDRSATFRSFAQMLGVPEEILVSRMDLTSNRSMTAAEAELLVRLNKQVKQQMQWDEYVRFVRRGVALGMVEDRQPDPGEPRLETPDWALDAAAEQGAKSADAIAASGVTVLGSLDALRTRAPGSSPVPERAVESMPVDAAVAAVTAVLARVAEPKTAREHLRAAARLMKARIMMRVRKSAGR